MKSQEPHDTNPSISRRKLMVGSAAFAGLALSPSSAGAAQEAADNISAPSVQTKAAVENGLRLGPIVETANGKVRGYVSGGIHTFRGLRYGAPTGGANRFKPPVAPEPWTGVMETYVAAGGNIAPQAASRPDAERPSTDALDPDSPPMSEDCLFLNLFTPGLNNDGKRPVMVFLHGGAWATGAGTGSMFDGTRLARRGDTVIISINHRLNLFGYLYLAEILGEDYANSGNSGVLDIIAALRWVNVGQMSRILAAILRMCSFWLVVRRIRGLPASGPCPPPPGYSTRRSCKAGLCCRCERAMSPPTPRNRSSPGWACRRPTPARS